MRSTTLLIVLQALPVALSASSLHGKQRCIEHNVLATNTTQFIPQHLVFFGDAALHKPLNPAAKKIKKQGHKEQEVLHVKPAESVSTTSPPRRKPKPEIWAEQDDVGQLGLGAYVGVPVETSQVTAEVPVLTTTLRLGVAQIPFRPSTLRPQTKGYILTALPTWGNPTTAPILSTLIPTPTTTLAPAAAKAASPKSSSIMSAPSSNIFQPIDTSAPPQSIGRRSDHPAPRTGIQQQTTPIGTNKFYANFFLGGQAAASWTHPYSVAWAKGSGASGSWGLAISHIDSNQRVFGPNKAWGAAEFFYSPVGLQSIVLSATSLGSTTRLVTNGLTAFAANVNLLPREGAAPAITFPLVQGMGFVTAIYKATTPAIQTGMFIRSMTAANSPRTGIVKYKLLLEDGKTWLLYAWSPSGARLTLNLVNNGLVQATSNFDGFIQVAKSTNATSEATYDRTCGNFATGVNLSGSVNGNVGTYAFNFSKAGRLDAPLVMFALPHHIASLHDTTRLAMVNVELDTTTKGKAQAIVADSWIMQEGLPVNMDFRPGLFPLSDTAKNTIASLAQSEVSQDMNAQTNLNSMYFAGKGLAKFAGIVYTIHDLLGNKALALAGLEQLKRSFAVFAENRQQHPLVYESAWGGVVSSASYTLGDSGADFGNTYYNDHHFHYAYHVLTAAIIGYLDPSWVPANRAYVNALVRDYANPSTADRFFPVSRAFDWYHGHSWAHGLYESYDGKNQESSSEDSLSAYAIKMWGRTIGDANMQARGNLQLAINARAIKTYYLYEGNNAVQPSNYIGNRCAGILFENKLHHTTFFGSNLEFIQGIHMLPLLPSSTLTRTKRFVAQEWEDFYSRGRVDQVAGGWRGVLYANLALTNPQASWNFFSQPNFDPGWIDGGASRTWYLAYAAGLGAAR